MPLNHLVEFKKQKQRILSQEIGKNIINNNYAEN